MVGAGGAERIELGIGTSGGAKTRVARVEEVCAIGSCFQMCEKARY